MATSYVCPKCHRETFSPKWQQCSAEGCVLNPRTGAVDRMTGVKPEPQAVRPVYAGVEAPVSQTAPAEPTEDDAALRAEIVMLREEVARLKRERAQANGGDRVALTPAEKQRAYRQRRKGVD